MPLPRNGVLVGFSPMLGERTYMRNVTPWRRSSSALTWVILLTIGAYVIENIWMVWFRTDLPINLFGLSTTALREGWIWTLLSYAFLHDPISDGGIWHIGFNLILIFFTGRLLEPEIGTKNFLTLYGFSTLVGGLLWALLHWSSQGVMIGASAAGMGLLTVFCLLHAEEPMTFLLFFVLPLTIKPKWFLAIVAAIEGLGFLANELSVSSDKIAHSAHLGGMLAGFIFYALFKREELSSWGSSFKRVLGARRGNRQPHYSFKVDILNEKALRAEVDRILDKINAKGFASLTPEEKATLDKARDLLR